MWDGHVVNELETVGYFWFPLAPDKGNTNNVSTCNTMLVLHKPLTSSARNSPSQSVWTCFNLRKLLERWVDSGDQ